MNLLKLKSFTGFPSALLTLVLCGLILKSEAAFQRSRIVSRSDLTHNKLIYSRQQEQQLQQQHQQSCFPSSIPSNTDLGNWWCNPVEEYGWLGFSYGIESCPSRDKMVTDFTWMKQKKGARYVRLYSGCDSENFDNDVIEAAFTAGIGVFSLIWFGFDGDDKCKGRKDKLLQTIEKNPKAPYVIRAVTCGSEPLFDSALPVDQLVEQIEDLKKRLHPHGIAVTLSEMPAGYQKFQDTPQIFSAVDFVSLHSFAFFGANATTADQALPTIEDDINYGAIHGKGRKVIITQTGWPSNSDVWKPNSPKAVTSLEQSATYFSLLDKQCESFKSKKVAWFSHIYSDTSLPGWGIVYENGTEKFPFNPRSSC